MNACETCQSQLLHHVYGLLEGPELDAVLAHLAACEGCRAALKRAQPQQEILSLAARAEFPEMRFTAPPRTAAPRVLSLPRRRRWLGWAAAAAVALLALTL